MPTYAYHCTSCNRDHEEFRFMNEPGPEQCPHCGVGSPKFGQTYHGGDVVTLVRGEARTIGQQAELNAKRVGRESLEQMAQQDEARVSKFTGKLPSTARPIVSTGETPPWRDGSFGTKPLDKPLDLDSIKNVKQYIEKGETS